MRPFLGKFLAVLACAALAAHALSQTPVLLPSTISAVAGSTPVSTTAGSACAAGSPFTATDIYGDGCPAINAVFQSTETSIAVDPAGNIYLSNNSANQIVRRIDARTGLINKFAGSAASQCAGGSGVTVYGTKDNQTDKTGDNCPVTYSYGFNGPVSLGVDPYGNVLIASTGDLNLHMVCNAISPACSSAAVSENLMITVAGCSTSTTGYGVAVVGTTPGTGGDGKIAVQTGVGTCSSANGGGVDGRIYGVVADKWDNIYFADAGNTRFRVVAGASSITVNGSILNNPLYVTLSIATTSPNNYSTVTQGYIYPIAGGASAVCSGSTDTYGDGCPFYQTQVSSSNSGVYMQGVAVDNEGDFIFADGHGNLRVIYEGGTVVRGALSAVGITIPQIGYSYALMKGTAINYNSGNPGIALGSNAGLQSSAIQTLTVDPGDNIIIGDQEQVLFYDLATGYVRRLGTSYGFTACAAATDSFGDGCPLAQSSYNAANKALYVATDALGNLYMLDLNNHLIRRVSTQTLPTVAVNGSLTSSLTVHAPVTGSSVAITAASGSDFTVGTPSCTTNTSSDNSVDCTATVTYSPKKLASRADAVAIATTVGGNTTTQNIGLNATSTGAALVFDTSVPNTAVYASGLNSGTPAMMFDGMGNLYTSGSGGISKITPSGTVTSVPANSATYMAVDPQGNVYTNSGANYITKLTYNAATGSYTTSVVAIPYGNICTTSASSISCASGPIHGGPMAVDAQGVIYVIDTTSLHAFKFSQNGLLAQQLTQTKFTSPTAVTQDTYGNLLVVDGTSILIVPAAGYPVLTTSPTANLHLNVAGLLSAPSSIAVDQAGNVYIVDSGLVKVQTASNAAQTSTDYLYTLQNVSAGAVAVDGAGNLYVMNPNFGQVTEVLRSAQGFVFGTNVTESYAGAFLNAGGTNGTGFAQTDSTTDFTESTPSSPLASGASTCNLGTSSLLSGAICNVSFSFTPTANGNGDTPNNITLATAGFTNTLGSLYLDGTKSGSTATTTTAITGNTTGLVYSTGTETTLTVTVTESPTAVPTGTVAVSIDNGTAVNYTLTQASSSTATATVTISGLSATTHTIYASYAASSGIAGSNSGNVGFSISAASTSVSWTPSSAALPYSSAVGTSYLNATSSSTGASGSVPGAFIYTATPTTGGSAQNIHSASYLAQGSYTLGVTFVPSNTVNFTQSTASGGTLTVTKATTTAGFGATQTVVAASGGNYTSVQAAVNALPSGGSIYIAPGTYTGNITVVQPNISFRGLGGDPTKVILTHPGGSFGGSGNTGVYQYAGEFTSAQNNGSQLASGSTVSTGDAGSATLFVAKGTNTSLSSTQQTPSNFYAENLSLINSYNTDSTMTTTYVSGGNCVAGNSPSYSYQTLYNMGIQCASQALAIWTTADLSVMNNVITTSQQDTIYAASPGSGSNGYVPTRQYWFRGKISGNVDFIFGDAAAVFDSTSIYTTYHGTATGSETIEAQNQAVQTGASNAYLSGYVLNNAVLTSQSSGMTGLYFGRPYGTFSTWVMLNTFVDQVNALGYNNSLGVALNNATYLEYNDILYTDPATGTADLNGVIYGGTGGSNGQGVTGTREATSTNPGTPSSVLSPPVSLTQAFAQAYYPTNFLSQTVSSLLSSTANWNPTAALAGLANAFPGSGSSASIVGGTSVTLLMRPQTPGLGAIVPTSYSAASPTPVVFTIPTGTYTLSDTFNGNTTTIASGSLDATGEAYYMSSGLIAGTHSLTWTYGGDSNFSGSTSSAYTLTISGSSTTTSLSGSGVQYGQSASITATVASGSGTPGGSVTLTIDGATTQTMALSGGTAVFTVTGLSAGNHSFAASYSGASMYTVSSTTSNLAVAVSQAPLQATSSCANRIFDRPNVCSVMVTGYQYTDTAATVFAAAPTVSTPALPNSPATTYSDSVAASLSSFGGMNYTLSTTGGTFMVTGNAAQSIIFPALSNFLSGYSYQLTAYTTSGLPVVYSVTSGNATVSGTTLTITAPGPVTVMAYTNADPTGDYALAASVSRSFTAQ